MLCLYNGCNSNIHRASTYHLRKKEKKHSEQQIEEKTLEKKKKEEEEGELKRNTKLHEHLQSSILILIVFDMVLIYINNNTMYMSVIKRHEH